MKQIDPYKYSKSQTDKAGIILSDQDSSSDDKDDALMILSNWRASHSYPMHIFKKRLKLVSQKIDRNALSAQRLKRVPSIIRKLRRKYDGRSANMKLTRMQDIAGCRAVMSTVRSARELYENNYLKSDLKHKLVNKKDYIYNPKEDGYRSLHLVYRFNSDKGKSIYNGLLVEVQIRSKLQHIWATAVETVGLFTGQAIKSNEGTEDWNSFFRLVSSAFAKLENSPGVPNTPTDDKELYSLIKRLEASLNIISKMEKWAKSIKLVEDFGRKKNLHFFLLEIDTIQEQLLVSGYTKRQEDLALKAYSDAERKIYGKPEYDVVLVGADTVSDLKKAYPNYFSDTKEFIRYLGLFLSRRK